MSNKPIEPIEEKFNWKNTIGIFFHTFIHVIICFIMFVASIIILSYYILLIWNKGFFDKETIQFSIYMVIGGYFFLMIDKNKIEKILGIKKNLEFIGKN